MSKTTSVTVDLRIDGELSAFIHRLSSDSGKKPETVIAVLLALYMQEQRTALKETK